MDCNEPVSSRWSANGLELNPRRKFPVTFVNYLVTVDNVRQVVTEHSGTCSSCGVPMAVGSLAQINDSTGLVVCASCSIQSETSVSESVRLGTPGGSAQREFERRRRGEIQVARQKFPIRLSLIVVAAVCGYIAVQIFAAVLNHGVETHVKATLKPVLPPSTAHGIGILFAFIAAFGVARALWGRRQNTYSWASGAKGERAVAARLARVSNKGVISLHDRKIPGSRANIDHIAVGPSGIFVIDSKVVSGKISARTTGPIFNRGPMKLIVGGRDKSHDVQGMARQVVAVRVALNGLPWATELPITPMLTLVGADVGLFSSPRTVQGVWVGWPKVMARIVSRPGPLSPEVVDQVARTIAAKLREA